MQMLFVFAALAMCVGAVFSGVQALDESGRRDRKSIVWLVLFCLCALGAGVMCSAFGVAFALDL